MTDKVNEILNNDSKAKKMKTMFMEEIEKQNLKGKELEEARKDMMMFIIGTNKEARKEMAKEVYNKARV